MKGRLRSVPALRVDDRTIRVTGRFIRHAAVHDQLYLENGIVSNPAATIDAIRKWDAQVDVFEFIQLFTDPDPKYAYRYEMDNLAVMPITDYEAWLSQTIKKDVKENLRRSRRDGVEVRCCDHNLGFAQAVKRLYDQIPLRQGRPFWHHGKDAETILAESGHYRDRSEFIGAFVGDELIGFLKMVYVGSYAKTMYVITNDRHFRLRPANALIAKAVEVCAAKGIRYFNYGQYEYPGKANSSLTTFKARHGFRRFDFPKYYVPLTFKGRVYIYFGLHRGFRRLLPNRVLSGLLAARSAVQHRLIHPAKHIVRALAGTPGGRTA